MYLEWMGDYREFVEAMIGMGKLSPFHEKIICYQDH